MCLSLAKAVTMANSKRLCIHCKTRQPREGMVHLPKGYFCNDACIVAYVRAKTQAARDKEAKRQHRAAKQGIKTRADWLREAQQVFNQWVRLRDADQPCISCGRHHAGQYHAGHYRTVGAMPQLRFEPLNVHKQCAPCNNHKSGNIVEYRLNLLQKIGASHLAWLEGDHPLQRLKVEDIKKIKATYKAKVKELQNG